VQKIAFVSIILLIGLFSLQLNLKSSAGFYKPVQAETDNLQIEHVNSKPLKNKNVPHIFPLDTIEKYYFNNSQHLIKL
jgi:hypothetical protein